MSVDMGSSKDMTVTVGIKGMSCSSCVAKIEGDIQKLVGVHSISISLMGEKGVVVFDPVTISTEGIVTAIRALGYDCQVSLTLSIKVFRLTLQTQNWSVFTLAKYA